VVEQTRSPTDVELNVLRDLQLRTSRAHGGAGEPES
jgi:hypothetical protein